MKRLAQDQEVRRLEAIRKRSLFEQLMSETLIEKSSSTSTSSVVTPVSHSGNGPPVKQPKLENTASSSRSMFD